MKPALSPEEHARYSAADPLIDVVDELDEALAMLRVAWAGLCDPDNFLASKSDCTDVMNFATGLVERTRNKAEEFAKELRGGA
jgi:hypothetical protein